MEKHYDTIFILGGGLKKEGDKWRTTKYEEGDDFGATGDSVRVIAGSYLFKQGLTDHIIVSCGPGQYRNRPEIPNVASVMKQELIALEIPADKVEVENLSNNTYQQLKAAQAITSQRGLRSIGIVSNKWHLPRVQAMLDYSSELDYIKKIAELIGAEDVLLNYAPDEWQEIIYIAYKSEAIQKRMALEQKGVEDILKGNYIFK